MSFASVFSRFRPASLHRASVRTLLLATAVFLPGVLRAQSPGSLDTAFTSALSETTVFTVTTQYVLGAEFIIAGGDEAGFDVLTSDGSASSGFTDPDFGSLSRRIYTVVPETKIFDAGDTAPKLLLGGRFGKIIIDKVTTLSRNVLRMNLAGTLDTSFNPGTGADDFVTSLLPQADGTIFVGGLFSSFNGVSYPRLVRLNRDGSIDTAFPSLPIGDTVFSLAAQIDPATGAPNGQVLACGDFSNIGSSAYTKIVRFDQAGNIDTSFKPVIDSRVITMAVQPDGKIVIGGQFASVNGTAVGHLARLNQDGSLDTTFNASVSTTPTATTAPVAVYYLNLLSDGRLYVGGNFYTADGVTRHYLARIETDGSLDTAFDPGANIKNSVQSVAAQEDNRVLVAETVSKKDANSAFPPSLIRLYGDAASSLSTITVTTNKGTAQEGTTATREVGEITFLRSGGDTTVPLTVYFETSGTAQSGTGYKPLAVGHYSDSIDQVTFPASVNKVHVRIKPLNNVLNDAPENLTFTLLPSQNPSALYNTAAPVVGAVEINNAP